MQKPEQMHVPPKHQDMDDPSFTPKESAKLQGMKWLQAQGLQYASPQDDGDYLFLRSKSSQKENQSSPKEN